SSTGGRKPPPTTLQSQRKHWKNARFEQKSTETPQKTPSHTHRSREFQRVPRCQTLSMKKLSVSPIVYAELPSEARALLSIFAQAAAARYVAQPLKKSELTPILESIWNRNRLCLNDVGNPFRMTALLETELSSVCLAGGAQ